ncbi:prepilin-type N-terminal cleavage/methylation domain-containing protein [Halomonas sp. HNIBRBA4712]|uniref:prepilin-type N-terminal cleavage/methylation domain-containing protein n=1 Tax=Halomonas sp. HNIBRBA4712 TaxID=3373087 RepID=UPI003745D8E2
MNAQRGFTLSEALVAVVLSSLVVIGAGQLLLSGFHTFREVDRLGRQQEALVYTATALADRLRVQGGAETAPAGVFQLVCRKESGACRCTVQDNEAAQPLVTFESAGEGSCARDEPMVERVGDGVYYVTLPLGPGGKEIGFHVTSRQNTIEHTIWSP